MSDTMAKNCDGRSEGDDENHGGEGKSNGGIMADPSRFYELPEDCISTIFSFTSPRDACISAAVSRIFQSAAQSDIIWESFLPPEYPSLVPESWAFPSKKELYLALCDKPLLIDDGKKSFWLEKSSGKKCYMLSARDITIIWGDTPQYWQWISLPESRFEEVAVLRAVCWLEICGKINTRMLCPETHYAAYIVFKMGDRCSGFESQPIEAGVGVTGIEVSRRSICFDTVKYGLSRNDYFPYSGFLRRFGMRPSPEEENNLVPPMKREDGWMEVELGEFFNNGGVDGYEIEMSALETKGGHWKCGLIVEGIEIRPKEGN